ncbi:hypothetical protein [Hallella bergensis]|uniref:hypothetical protein n=1 Tax=Hallella bergensis TaxID=242750 RepID=UPI003990C0C5
MKRLVLIAIAWLMCMSTYAQAYEVDFSVDQEKTTVSYKIKNNTKDYMAFLKGFISSIKSYCLVYYTTSNGELRYIDIDVLPDDKNFRVIKPGETYQFQFELSSYRKKYHVTKLEGVFDFLYRESANDDLVPVRIKKVITL